MDKEQLGQLLIYLRKCNNMQQKELAEKLCVSASTVSKWENGINLPDTATLIALAEIFHLPENAFLRPEETLELLKSNNMNISDRQDIHVAPTVRTQPGRTNIIGYVCALFLLLALLLVLVCIHRYLNPSFTLVTTRYVETADCGTVYEMSVVSPPNVTQDALYEYTDIIHEEWINNQYAEDADSIQLYFYPNKEAALQWNDELITILVLFK